MIHQELSPVTERSVAENLYLGRPPMKAKVFVDHKQLYRLARETLQGLGIDIDPYEKMGNLTVAKMQMVEIAKAVSQDASIIVMDEPTSSLTSIEVAQLFGMIRNLREKGVSIIYISHKMEEIFKICDDVTVFRDGQMVGSDLVSNMDVTKLIHLMVGRDLDAMFPKIDCPITDVVMEVRDLASGSRFSGISFDLRRGEILGFAGLVGAGVRKCSKRFSVCAQKRPVQSRSMEKSPKSHVRQTHSNTAWPCSPRTAAAPVSSRFPAWQATSSWPISNSTSEKTA